MATSELYWAAGFYDGEGTFGSARRGFPRKDGTFYRWNRMGIDQKHREVLDRFLNAVGMGNVCQLKSGLYRYDVAGKKAELVASLLYPFIGSVKQEQIIRAVEITADSRRK